MTKLLWRAATSVAVLAGVTACGGTATVDDLARAAGGVDDTARLKASLRAANGGSSTVGRQVADEFQRKPGVIRTVMAKPDPAVAMACDAFAASRTVTESRAGVDWARSQQTLAQMRDLVSRGEVAAQTVTFACEVQDALGEW
jgi:hypothetical protein